MLNCIIHGVILQQLLQLNYLIVLKPFTRNERVKLDRMFLHLWLIEFISNWILWDPISSSATEVMQLQNFQWYRHCCSTANIYHRSTRNWCELPKHNILTRNDFNGRSICCGTSRNVLTRSRASFRYNSTTLSIILVTYY